MMGNDSRVRGRCCTYLVHARSIAPQPRRLSGAVLSKLNALKTTLTSLHLVTTLDEGHSFSRAVIGRVEEGFSP